jgi:hypothetical protein
MELVAGLPIWVPGGGSSINGVGCLDMMGRSAKGLCSFVV